MQGIWSTRFYFNYKIIKKNETSCQQAQNLKNHWPLSFRVGGSLLFFLRTLISNISLKEDPSNDGEDKP